MSNWMIEPNYTKKPELTKIELTGRVLVFGSGKLTHEDIFFDFSSAENINCFDPIYQTTSEQPTGRGEKWLFYSMLDDAINGGNFDHVVAFFSLHYEPAWIQTLTRLLSSLKPQGIFYFAEDSGFRAVLDGTIIGNYQHPEADHIRDVFKKRHRLGGKNNYGTPWLPDIRASNYRQLGTMLDIYGFSKTSEPISGLFQRQLGNKNLREEAAPYLPWRSGENWESGLNLLENTAIEENVEEIVLVHQYRRSNITEMPATLLCDSSIAEVVRSLVFKQTANAIGKLDLVLPTDKVRVDDDRSVYSQLKSFGCSWLSILYQHLARHIPEIEAIQLIFQRVGDHEDMAEALSSYEFEGGDPFLTCNQTRSYLEAWNYQWTERYEKYIKKLNNSPENIGYLAKPIFQTGTLGVYWDGNNAQTTRDSSHKNLTDEFKRRDVPSPCLYIPARLAHVEGEKLEELRPLTLIALIVYFRDETSLNDSAWQNLHSLLLPLLENVSARIALGEMLAGHHHKRLLKEREKSHQMLMKLQVPLDELTRAFDTVQAEAHEMQVILNSPEESLFRAQKLVSDIFIDRKGIKVSDALTAKPAHSPDSLKDDDLHMLYVLVLCSVFGRRAELKLANSPAAILAHGKELLRDAERSPVFEDLCSLISIISESREKKVSIWETVDAFPDESTNTRDERQRRVLSRFKALLFEPFKDFSSKYWPKSPFYVAVEGQEARLDCLDIPKGDSDLDKRLAVKHDFSPFPQHGILDFILAAKGEFENRTQENLFSTLDLSENTDARAVLKITYEGDTLFLPEKASNHFIFLCHAAAHGVSGSNYGNFLGSYARLLRHAHSLDIGSSSSSENNVWRLCNPNRACVSLAIERSDKRRFFWIEHHHNTTNGKGTLSLVWSECGWRNEKAESGTAAIRRVTDATAPAEEIPERDSDTPATIDGLIQPKASPSSDVKCFVSDHNSDAQWANALKTVGKIEGKRGTVNFVGMSKGTDRPSDVTIPPGVQVVVLHTNNISDWLQECNSTYAIVRVSTQPDGLTLPDGAPASVKLLKDIVPNHFALGKDASLRKQAESKMLEAVFDALNQKIPPVNL
ncbi:MAG: hypothetical protein ACFE0O_04505 [Opitutales bacterium]